MSTRSTRVTSLIVAAASLVAALALFYPAFFSLQATGFGDWQFFHHMWEAGYVAVLRHGEWPLWDPYHCGGITIFGNPQSQHLSPLYLLAFLAGPTLGSKLFLIVHAWAGFAGLYSLARARGLALSGAVLASLAWAGSGFFVSHGSGGHSAFLPFYFAPWLLLCWQRAAAEPRWVLAVVGVLVLTLLEGGVYPFPYFTLLLIFDALVRLGLRERVAGVLWAGVASAALVALCGAIRLLPIADELRRSPRAMPGQDSVSVRDVLEMLTVRQHAWRYPGHTFVWPEYVTYVGYGVLGLALLGVLVALFDKREHKRWLSGLVLFMLFMMGDQGVWSPWSLVHRLPVYDSLRVPSRFAVFFTLYLALLAGLGLDMLVARAARWLHPTAAQMSGLLVCVVIACDFGVVHFPTLNRWIEPPVISDRVSERYFLSPLNYGRHYASFPRMNLGSRNCYEAMTFTPARGLWNGDVAQARIIQGSGELQSFRRSSRTATLHVLMRTSGRVLVNQNDAPGWSSDVGVVVPDAGKLALQLPAGEHTITLRYTPPTLWPALALTLLGLLLSALYAWRTRASLERS